MTVLAPANITRSCKVKSELRLCGGETDEVMAKVIRAEKLPVPERSTSPSTVKFQGFPSSPIEPVPLTVRPSIVISPTS